MKVSVENIAFPYSYLKKESVFGILVLISILLTILSDTWIFTLIPLGFLFIWVSILKPIWVYYLLICTIPFSIEVDLPGGFSIDFPDELLMWWLFGLGIVFCISHWKNIRDLLCHPISWIVLIHFIWIVLVSISSENKMIALKYTINKSWYIMVYYVLAYYFLYSIKRLSYFAWAILLSTAITVIYALVRHSVSGFAFSEINSVLRPFYRNHVNYACLLICVLPYIYPLFNINKEHVFKKYLIIGLGLILIAGIAFAYTRAAYIALISILGVLPILYFKLTKMACVFSIVISVSVFGYYTNQNTYLELAPEYTKAISHTEFGNLLSATTEGKDISTMERLYRWVAGARMIAARPLLGFGPGNFYESYKPYTLNQFTTYVSDNEERSSIHNYFLMTAVEQGIPGLVIFTCILFFFYYMAQKLIQDNTGAYRPWLTASIWSFSAILVILLFNDMVETDKVGSFFFMNIAILATITKLQHSSKSLINQ